MRLVLRVAESVHAGRLRPDSIPLYPAPELLVHWSSRAADFPGNLAVVLAGPRPSSERLRGYTVPLAGGVMRPASLGVSVVVHAVIVMLLAAISLAFGKRPPTAAELEAEHQRKIAWYYFSDELPSISPSVTREPAAETPKKKNGAAADRQPEKQSIISIPAKADNFSQTILQPDAPDIRITRHVPLPNIVMWPSARPTLEYLPPPDAVVAQAPRLPSVPAQKPSLEYLPAPDVRVSRAPVIPAPQAERPVLDYLPAPQVAVRQAPRVPAQAAEAPSLAYLPPPNVPIGQAVRPPAAAVERPTLEYLPAPNVRVQQNPRLPASGVERPSLNYLPPPEVRVNHGAGAQLPPAQAAPVEQAYAAAPPPIATATQTDKRLIALGLDPTPPAPQLAVPVGNRAGQFSTAGEPAGDKGSGSSPQSRASSLTVPGLSISGGVRPPSADVGPVVSGPRPPAAAGAAPAESAAAPARPPADAKTLANLIARATRPQIGLPEMGRGRLPAESGILSGKKIYTTYINMPNLSSGAGSWVLRFSELGEHAAGNDGELTAPVARRKVDPGYDPDAVRDRIEGVVVLYAIIHHDGTVDSVKVVRSLDPRLDDNAVKALRLWQFDPARRNGAAVDLEAVVHIPFSLAPAGGKRN